MIPPPRAEAVDRFRRDLAALLDRPPPGEAIELTGGGAAIPPRYHPARKPSSSLSQDEAASLLALAVSGGPDSLALLLLATAACPGEVIAATVDHNLRPEAAAEAHFVAELCADLRVPHVTLPITVPDDSAGPQAAARRARYGALESWALTGGARALAVGHHADDQAETILMRLGRGAGVSGLCGIRPRRIMWHGLPLVRPLLAWRRADLAEIVAAAGLTAVDDPSNRNTRYDRTRARTLLASGWPEPARLAAVAAHAAEAEAALAYSTDQFAAERLRVDANGISLTVDGLPREYRRRLTLRAVEKLTNRNDLRGDEVDRLLDRLLAGTVSTLAGVRISPGPIWRFTLAAPHRSV